MTEMTENSVIFLFKLNYRIHFLCFTLIIKNVNRKIAL
ncbi:MAG: hypothetical protein MCSN_2090 [Candidatus Microsyncoccus archaeolyticus]|nr:MAG: hypothetical protein MCSN_2090 [Candidatus Parcubacteria bacterium]